jgi:hypothetical protein
MGGALLAGTALWNLGLIIRPSLQFVGVVGLLAALVEIAPFAIRLPSSSWRIPRHWAQEGALRTAAIFGGLLGSGFATATSSAGLFVVWSWAFAAPSWSAVWPVAATYGFCRGIPLLLLEVQLPQARVDVVAASAWLAVAIDRLRYIELLAVSFLAASLLLHL